MKKILAVLAFALAGATSGFAQTPANDTLRILAIGNSFSVDAVNENFGDLCVAAGHHVILGNLYIGGCSLERHLKSLKNEIPDYTYYKRTDDGKLEATRKTVITTGIFDEPWDIVTFQQASRFSGQFESYEPYLGELLDYVKANVPSAKRFMWHQTWAYHADAVNPSMKKAYGSQKGMYEAICEASKAACDKYGLEIIPCGTAIQNLRSSFERDNCNRDGNHLSYTTGRYTAACTWFEAIYHESVLANAYSQPNLLPYRTEVCRNAAHLASEKPFVLTNMAKLGFEAPAGTRNEAEVPLYTLPDALVMQDGTPVKNKKDWMEKRRPELLGMFTEEMFGKVPDVKAPVRFEVERTKKDALGGKASFKEVRIYYSKKDEAYITLLMVIPNNVKSAPVFLGINFKGNYAITDDKWVTIPPKDGRKRFGILENTERGVASSRWPLETIVDAGYAVVTFYRGDVAPDTDNSFNLGVFKYIHSEKSNHPEGFNYPASDEWGNIAAWTWGLSRAMDYLETDSDVDAKRVAVFGHSRLGKTALWAGATDQRFAMVISNDSGCCGAALSRRCFGETVEMINKHFPHWFCDNFKKYNGRENELPFDQHELLALIAPRPLYVASADMDLHADPTGEGLALQEAEKVYKLFGKPKTGRHIRPGKHDIQLYDWERYIKFADKYLK